LSHRSKEEEKKKKKKGKRNEKDEERKEEDEHLESAQRALLRGVVFIYGEEDGREGSFDHLRNPFGRGGSVAYLEKKKEDRRNKNNKKSDQSHSRTKHQ